MGTVGRFGRLSGFVSDEARREYFAAYDATLALTPMPVEPIDVETPFGTTRVLAAGPKDGPSLLVLHGGQASATMWLDVLPIFTATHRVYLVDGIGELGRSVVTRMLHGSADVVTWLEAVLAGLAIDRCGLVGLSNGGFQAVAYATARPERVERIGLLAPAGVFLPIRWSWWWRTVTTGLLGSDRARIERWFSTHVVSQDPSPLQVAWTAQLVTGLVGQRMAFRGQLPHAYRAARIRRMTMPVLVVVGEQEVIYDPSRFAARVRDVLPSARVEVLPGCGHIVNFDQPEQTAKLLGAFLAGSSDLTG